MGMVPRACARSSSVVFTGFVGCLVLLAACYGGAPGASAGPTTASATLTTGASGASEASSDVPTSMSSGTGETITGGSAASAPTSGGASTDASGGTGTTTEGLTGTGTGATDPATTVPATSDPGDTSTSDPSGDPGPSCGELAAQLGWGDDALCEQNGDGICEGTGEPTWDCERCCDASALAKGGFGYPVGDLGSFPAGGWSIGQLLSNYYADYGGRHLAHDINHPNGGVATIDAPVYSVADGVVRYAGPNSSLYKHVVLIEHAVQGEDPVCSFYGHINAPIVATGDAVERGQQITTVMDWNLILGGSGNTHLHYGIVRKSLCDASAAASGALICGYDEAGPNDVSDLDSEPYSYQPVGDLCGDSNYGDVFISPTKFIEDHHF